MADVFRVMQVSNKISGYRAGARIYVGYINPRGEYIETKNKLNTRTGKTVRVAGLEGAIRKAGDLERRSETRRNRNARRARNR